MIRHASVLMIYGMNIIKVSVREYVFLLTLQIKEVIVY